MTPALAPQYGFFVRFTFVGEIVFWKGPAPFHFVLVPGEESHELRQVSTLVSYGWGVLPVEVSIGSSTWATSLIPKNGIYLVPIKASIRDIEGVAVGDQVSVSLNISL